MRYDTIVMSKTIQVKGASEELRARLESSAHRNFRSLNQETLARLEFSFDMEDALMSKVHQTWIDEAMAGTFKPGSLARLKQIAAKAKAAR
jgi:mannosyltransferase OCH1-like enzyme